jgi:hypothetical protein
MLPYRADNFKITSRQALPVGIKVKVTFSPKA